MGPIPFSKILGGPGPSESPRIDAYTIHALVVCLRDTLAGDSGRHVLYVCAKCLLYVNKIT